MIRACAHPARPPAETFAETLATFAAGLRPADLSRGESVTVSIRPHTVAVAAGAGPDAAADGGVNVFAGAVTRASDGGDAMDYQVAIMGTAPTLRAAGAPEPRFAVGQPVIARIEARACIVAR